MPLINAGNENGCQETATGVTTHNGKITMAEERATGRSSKTMTLAYLRNIPSPLLGVIILVFVVAISLKHFGPLSIGLVDVSTLTHLVLHDSFNN